MIHIEEVELHEYLDGEVAEWRRRAIEQHLQTCPTCSAQLAELRSLFVTIQSLPEVALKRDLSAAVVASIQADAKESPGWAWWLLALQLISAVAAIPFAWRFVTGLWPPQLEWSSIAALGNVGSQMIDYWQQPFTALIGRVTAISVLAAQPLTPSLPLLTWIILVLVMALLWAGGTGWVLAHNSDRLVTLDSKGDSI